MVVILILKNIRGGIAKCIRNPILQKKYSFQIRMLFLKSRSWEGEIGHIVSVRINNKVQDFLKV